MFSSFRSDKCFNVLDKGLQKKRKCKICVYISPPPLLFLLHDTLCQFSFCRREACRQTRSLLGRSPNGLDGWWGGDNDRRLIYGSCNGQLDLETWLGPAYQGRTGFIVDKDHVMLHHFDREGRPDKSKFDLSFTQVAELCPSVLRFPNRVRKFHHGMLFSGVFEGNLGGGGCVLRVWVDIHNPVAIRSFYLDHVL